ncbi:transposase (fragment) [Cupriavidus taiwanensis]|uniref:Transposase n=1 Tax=Cupriavidus taiwanensis TaxID=164546 RepID=A0A375FKM0_9BURK
MSSTPATVTAAELQLLRDAERELEAILAEREAIKGELHVMMVQRDLLLEQLKTFQRKLLAAKSEARASDQKDLFLNESKAMAAAQPAQEEEGTPETEVAKRGRKPHAPALPRVEVHHELPESERVYPLNGQTLIEIGVEFSEQRDIVPQRVRVIQTSGPYACSCCDGGIKTTPAPARIIPKRLLSAGHLDVSSDQPLYRQAALLHRFGGDLSRGTLVASVVRMGQAVPPIINLLRDYLLEADVVCSDETVVQVLMEPGRPAQRKSCLWARRKGTGPPVGCLPIVRLAR